MKPSQTVGNMQVTITVVACFYYIQISVKINLIVKLKLCRFCGALGNWTVHPSGPPSDWPFVRILGMRYIAISLNKNTHAPFVPAHGYHFVLDSRRSFGYSAEFWEWLTPRMLIFTGFARLTDRTVPLVAKPMSSKIIS